MFTTPGRRSVAGRWRKVGGVSSGSMVVGGREAERGRENMVMRVCIRRGLLSFHLENEINGANHIISANSALIRPVR